MRNKNKTLSAIDYYAFYKANASTIEQLLTYTEWIKRRGLLNDVSCKLIVKKYIDRQFHIEEHFKSVDKEVDSISKYANFNPDTLLLYDTECSVRLYNILIANKEKLGIETDSAIKLKDLNGLSMSKFLRCRNAGKKALEELKDLCFHSGVKLMK